MLRKVKSAERTMALLELFSREQVPFTVGHIARRLTIPQPSASMLLRNMQELGYLEFDAAARTYAPSIRVALLGAWIDRRFSEAGEIGERLGALQRQTGETAFIGIQNGAAAQYVLAQTPDHPDRIEVQSGEFRSLTQSAVGRALLAVRGDREVRQWVRRCNAEAIEQDCRVVEADFLDLIGEVRRDGYAETRGDVRAGFGAFAMTFNSPMGAMPLAVAVGGAIENLDRRRTEILDAVFEFRNFFGPASRKGRDAAPPAPPRR